jgi:hypothetical protein
MRKEKKDQRRGLEEERRVVRAEEKGEEQGRREEGGERRGKRERRKEEGKMEYQQRRQIFDVVVGDIQFCQLREISNVHEQILDPIF